MITNHSSLSWGPLFLNDYCHFKQYIYNFICYSCTHHPTFRSSHFQAAYIAMQRGWAINIGGGFHHCSATRGGGFCAYADITLAIKHLFLNPNAEGKPRKAMIVDLDAHQGNGHERDFMEDDNVYIMDVYNRDIYPHDGFAKRKWMVLKRKLYAVNDMHFVLSLFLWNLISSLRFKFR